MARRRERRALLVGCGKTKCTGPCQAEHLYTGGLFGARRNYAVSTGLPWAILSAKHGLVVPDQELTPYDVTLTNLSPDELEELVSDVAVHLRPWSMLLAGNPDVLEVHAGAPYVRLVERAVDLKGGRPVRVEHPLRGLAVGEQLGWYKAAREGRPLPSRRQARPRAAVPTTTPTRTHSGAAGQLELFGAWE